MTHRITEPSQERILCSVATGNYQRAEYGHTGPVSREQAASVIRAGRGLGTILRLNGREVRLYHASDSACTHHVMIAVPRRTTR
jgi:hypothetical protein